MRFSTVVSRVIALAAAVCVSAYGQALVTGENSLGISGDMQLKWIGKGVPQKKLDAEILISQAIYADTTPTIGADYDGRYNLRTTTALVSVFYHLHNAVDFKLSMPFMIKQGVDQSNVVKTGPFGDLSLDVSREWGAAAHVMTGLTIGLPTGPSSIHSSSIVDSMDVKFLSPDNQLGSGFFSASLRASYRLLPEWGLVNVGASYMAGLFAVRTTAYGYNTATKTVTFDNSQFESARDGWAARNEAGVVRPDRIGLFTDVFVKTETVNHGFAVGYYYPAAAEKRITLEKGIQKAPTQDSALAALRAQDSTKSVEYLMLGQTADQTWEYLSKTACSINTYPVLTLQYNLEKNDPTFPIFLGGMVKMEYNNRLNFAGFAIGLGFKFPVY
jgi:hypothetical protein